MYLFRVALHWLASKWFVASTSLKLIFPEKATNVFIETTHLTFCPNLNWLDANHVLIKLLKKHCTLIIPGRIDVFWDQCALCCGAGVRILKIKYLVKVKQVWICKKKKSVFHYFSRKTCFCNSSSYQRPPKFIVLKACLTLSFFIQQISRTESKGLWKYIFQKGK